MPLTTWLGLTARPGDAAGHGPLDADTSRDLASLLAARPGNRWCLTIIDPAGHAAGHGCAHAGPGPPGHPATTVTRMNGSPGSRSDGSKQGPAATPGNVHLPAVTRPAAPDQEPRSDVLVSGLPAARPAVR